MSWEQRTVDQYGNGRLLSVEHLTSLSNLRQSTKATVLHCHHY
uniref:Uncharacterized protein n=1 Tax=Arundo donax TaxID=35708 RepID=A0A0A9SMH8_ARUDO